MVKTKPATLWALVSKEDGTIQQIVFSRSEARRVAAMIASDVECRTEPVRCTPVRR